MNVVLSQTRFIIEEGIYTFLVLEKHLLIDKVNVLLIINHLQKRHKKRTFIIIYEPIKLNIMGLKYSKTTADYLVWSDAMNLIRNLAKDGNNKISLLVAIGCFKG